MRSLLWLLVAALIGCGPGQEAEDAGRAVIETAQSAIAAGAPADAIAPLLRRLDAAPDDALARATLSHAFLLVEDVERSLVHGKLAVGVDPGLATAAWNLACAHARLGDRDAAIAWLQRAVMSGGYGAEDVRDDADLSALLEDHRVAVFLAAGVLSRAEEDVVVQLDSGRVRVGEPLTLSIAVMQLNRAPLSVSAAQLSLGRDRGLQHFVIQSRRETFSRGEAGGREYVQRTVHFELMPQVPGAFPLGPFRVDGSDGVHWTSPVGVVVDGEPADDALIGASRFFAFPSEADPSTIEGVGGDRLPLWEPGSEDGGQPALPSATRFRVANLEGEIALPPRPEGAMRSTMLRRSTEGVSWVVDYPSR